MRKSRNRHSRRKPAARHATPAVLALGAALSGTALIASANTPTTIWGSTTANYIMAGAEDFELSSMSTIATPLSPGLGVDISVTNSTIAIDHGAKLLSSSGIGLQNYGQIDLIFNNGIISGAQTAIDNQNSIVLISNSGTISGTNAINNAGTLGTLSNSGTISGNIINSSASTLTLTGGSGATVGTFTGQSGMGTITNTSGDIAIISGNLFLNDNINVGSHTVANTGASISLSNTLSITGNYSQSAGLLSLASGSTLRVSDTALLSGGTVSSTLSPTGNYLAGNSVALISSGTLTASGVTVNISGISPSALAISSLTTGTSLAAQFNNDYIGGTLASATVTGSISATNGVYIANTGSLGTLTVSSSGHVAGSGHAIFNAGTLGVISNSGTISGDISLGSSAVTLAGGSGSTFGTLTGGTITSGASQLNLSGGNLLLDDDLVLASGSGTLVGNGGTLQLNGHHTLSGNYAQTAAQTLVIGVSDGATATGSTSDVGYGRLTVSGSATIASGSTVRLATTGSRYGFATGQRYVVIVANSSGTDYNASSLDYSATGFSGTVTGAAVADSGNSDLVLTLTDNSGGSTPGNHATQSNANQALAGLLNYSGTQADLLNLFNATAALSSSSEANAAGAQLSPVSGASANSQISTVTSQAATGVVQNRLGMLRSGGSGIPTGDDMPDKTVWIQAFAGHVSQGERDGVSGYSAYFNGLMIGADRAVGDRWHIGSAISYSTSAVSETGANTGSSVHNHAYGVHGYAGYDASSWYLDLDVSVDKLQYNSLRRIAFPGFSAGAQGNYTGTQFAASAQVGWPIKLDRWWADTTLTPIVNLAYTGLNQSGYTETGGNGAALTVSSVRDNSVASQLGVRLDHAYDTSWGHMTPYVHLGWRHEYLHSRLQTTASFAADSSGATSFTNNGATPLRDSAVLVLGATLAKSQRLTLNGRLQFDSGASYAAESINLTARYLF